MELSYAMTKALKDIEAGKIAVSRRFGYIIGPFHRWPTIEALERRGLVETVRVEDPRDPRISIYRLTDAGREAIA